MRDKIARCLGGARHIFNLWVLLATFFCTGIGLVALNAVLMFHHIEGDLERVCRNAGDAYDEGGPEYLRLLLLGVETGPGPRVHLVDAVGRDLATGLPIRNERVPKAGKPRAPQFPSHTLMLHSGVTTCVTEPPGAPSPIPFGPMFWVLPFVSLLCCSVGAYVTWRMRRIEAVVRHFGSGELAVRTPSDPRDAIGRLGKTFNQMADRIESLVTSHQRLCTDMAHELRSPLTRLLLAVPLARRGVDGAVDRIEREASLISRVVDELLELARAETNLELQTEAVDLESLMTEIADHCGAEAAARRCEIQTIAPFRSGFVKGHGELLRSAIENVLRNAVQHTPEGTSIQLAAISDPDAVTIMVRDWGSGVPEGALAEIFKPFYRVDAGRDRNSGGAGLGLAIARRAIALHGGSIHAENCAPGLRVVIRLPRT